MQIVLTIAVPLIV